MKKYSLKKFLFVTLISFSILFCNLFVFIYGDDKPISELIEDSTRDGIPTIRLAASLALVRAYYLLDKPLSDLRVITANTRKEGTEARELLRAITYAQNGYYISVCRKERKLSKSIRSMDLKELRRKALYGASSETRTEAASAIMEKVIESVGVDFNNYYKFRIGYEEKFDDIKKELERNWATYSVIPRNWKDHGMKELTEEVADTLGRMYLAEYLIRSEARIARDKVSCTDEDENNGEVQ